QRAGMNDGFDAMICESAFHDGFVGDRPCDLRLGPRSDVEPNDDVTGRPQPRRQEPAEPTRRTGEKDTHAKFRAGNRSEDWRRGWDSNPRYGVTRMTI